MLFKEFSSDPNEQTHRRTYQTPNCQEKIRILDWIFSLEFFAVTLSQPQTV